MIEVEGFVSSFSRIIAYVLLVLCFAGAERPSAFTARSTGCQGHALIAAQSHADSPTPPSDCGDEGCSDHHCHFGHCPFVAMAAGYAFVPLLERQGMMTNLARPRSGPFASSLLKPPAALA